MGGALRVLVAAAALAGLVGGCGGGGAPADRLFVSQASTRSVAVIDAASGRALARLQVGLLPHALLLSPDGRTIYVALTGSQAVAELDVATATVRRTFPTAAVPTRRADGSVNQAHLDAGALTGHASCADCHSGGPGGAAPAYVGARPFGLALTGDGRRLLVSHLRPPEPDRLGLEPGAIAVVDLASGAVERTVTLAPAGAATEAVALARVGEEVWVALRPVQPSSEPGLLRRLDGATLAPLGDVATGSDPVAILPLPDRGTAMVSHFETDAVSERDAAGAVVRHHQAAPGPMGLLRLPGGQAVLAMDYYSNALSFLDLAGGPSATVPLGDPAAAWPNPTHAALASDGRSAWVVSGGTAGRLLQVDLAARRVVRDLPIDGLSFGVVVVPAAAP